MLTTEQAGRIVDYFAAQDDCHEIRVEPCYRATLRELPDKLVGWYVLLGIIEIGSSHGYLVSEPAILDQLEVAA